MRSLLQRVINAPLTEKTTTRTRAENADIRLVLVEDHADFRESVSMVLADRGFLNPDNPEHLMRRLRRLYNRAGLDHNEVQILRGILTTLAPDIR